MKKNSNRTHATHTHTHSRRHMRCESSNSRACAYVSECVYGECILRTKRLRGTRERENIEYWVHGRTASSLLLVDFDNSLSLHVNTFLWRLCLVDFHTKQHTYSIYTILEQFHLIRFWRVAQQNENNFFPFFCGFRLMTKNELSFVKHKDTTISIDFLILITSRDPFLNAQTTIENRVESPSDTSEEDKVFCVQTWNVLRIEKKKFFFRKQTETEIVFAVDTRVQKCSCVRMWGEFLEEEKIYLFDDRCWIETKGIFDSAAIRSEFAQEKPKKRRKIIGNTQTNCQMLKSKWIYSVVIHGHANCCVRFTRFLVHGLFGTSQNNLKPEQSNGKRIESERRRNYCVTHNPNLTHRRHLFLSVFVFRWQEQKQKIDILLHSIWCATRRQFWIIYCHCRLCVCCAVLRCTLNRQRRVTASSSDNRQIAAK